MNYIESGVVLTDCLQEPAFKAGYSGSLPLTDYFELLDHHYAVSTLYTSVSSLLYSLSPLSFPHAHSLYPSSLSPLLSFPPLSVSMRLKLRCDLGQCREVMQRQSLQFRAVQKRLLTRFKDKTPSGLSHLDTLLEGTYRQVCTACT